jgi:mannose-1-phosphate guanylyltransferase
MVLAAGLGTRLRPLTDEVPKPLVPLGDRPMLSHVVDQLRKHGEERIVVNAFHHPEQLHAWAKGAGVFVSNEQDLLGTAGGVANARTLLGDVDVLVYNGDILADVDVAALRVARTGLACLAIASRAKNEGNVGLGEDGRVVRLRKTSFGPESRGGDFLGIHVIGKELVSTFPDRGGLIEDVYLPALSRGECLTAMDVHTPFTDLGTPEAYLAANLSWLVSRGVDSWVAPDAHVAGDVRLKRTIVGHGARVMGRGVLSECVVWPGAVVTAPLERAIVTPKQVVHVPSAG